MEIKNFKFQHILASISVLSLSFVSCSTDVNNPPESINVTASSIEITLSENPENGLVIGRILGATNIGSVSYQLLNENPAGALDLNTNTGEIKVADSTLFDFETHPVINADVLVSNGAKSAQSTIVINLVDVDESIFQGDVTLKTQEEVNAFGLLNYRKITGFLQIGELATENSSITNLSGLGTIEQVGYLRIFQNTALVSLEGLNNISGSVLALELLDNTNLENITGLSGITSVTNQLSVARNARLAQLSGLQNITTINGNLIITGNTLLESLSGLNGLTSVTTEFRITNNSTLSNLCGTLAVFTNGFNGSYIVSGNRFNPTQQNMLAGNCSN